MELTDEELKILDGWEELYDDEDYWRPTE